MMLKYLTLPCGPEESPHVQLSFHSVAGVSHVITHDHLSRGLGLASWCYLVYGIRNERSCFYWNAWAFSSLHTIRGRTTNCVGLSISDSLFLLNVTFCFWHVLGKAFIYGFRVPLSMVFQAWLLGDMKVTYLVTFTFSMLPSPIDYTDCGLCIPQTHLVYCETFFGINLMVQ